MNFKRKATRSQIQKMARKYNLPETIIEWRLKHGWPARVIGVTSYDY